MTQIFSQYGLTGLTRSLAYDHKYEVIQIEFEDT